MNDTTSKLSLAAAALLLCVSAARASAVAPMRALELADSEDMLEARVHAAAPRAAAKAKSEQAPAPVAAASAPEAAASGATAKSDAVPAPQRTQADPWAGLQNTGPVPLYNNPAPCLLPNDPFYQYQPAQRCPPDYMPGQQPLACGKNATMVRLEDSVICVSNGIGMGQLTGDITAQDRADADAFLKARGLAPSAAAFAVNALNGSNLQAFTCSRNGFVNDAPMQSYGEIEWNLMLFSYLYGPVKGAALTSGVPQNLPPLCSKKFNS
jgi:hypothetical protein